MSLPATLRGKTSLVLTDSQCCPTSRDIPTGVGFQLTKWKNELLDEMLMGLSNEINGPGKLKDRLLPPSCLQTRQKLCCLVPWTVMSMTCTVFCKLNSYHKTVTVYRQTEFHGTLMAKTKHFWRQNPLPFISQVDNSK